LLETFTKTFEKKKKKKKPKRSSSSKAQRRGRPKTREGKERVKNGGKGQLPVNAYELIKREEKKKKITKGNLQERKNHFTHRAVEKQGEKAALKRYREERAPA